MELTRTCANCQKDFSPTVDWQKCCSGRCTNALNQRRLRAKRRKGGGPDGGGNGGGPGLSDEGLFATIGGAVEQGKNGSVSDKNRYSVKSGAPKPPESVKPQTPPATASKKRAVAA